MEAIREKVKNSKFERFRSSAWHTLLSKHKNAEVKESEERNEGYLYRPAFGLKDLIKQQFH